MKFLLADNPKKTKHLGMNQEIILVSFAYRSLQIPDLNEPLQKAVGFLLLYGLSLDLLPSGVKYLNKYILAHTV